MILKINDHEQITEIRPGDRFFKARDVVEISREEFEARLERERDPLPFDWTPGAFPQAG